MSLLFSTISRGSDILVSHSLGRRDFTSQITTVLSKIPPNDSKLTYVWENMLIHYVSSAGTIYLVLADDAAGRRMPFAYLAELQRAFTSSYDAAYISSAPSTSFSDFEAKLGETMRRFNDNPPPDALQQAQNELNQVKDIMVHNVEQILSRGERIELLVDKTDHLSGQATAFRRGARQIRRQQFWRNQKILAIGIFAGLFFLYLLVAQICGFGLHCGSA